jgi:hypothetical protein
MFVWGGMFKMGWRVWELLLVFFLEGCTFNLRLSITLGVVSVIGC